MFGPGPGFFWESKGLRMVATKTLYRSWWGRWEEKCANHIMWIGTWQLRGSLSLNQYADPLCFWQCPEESIKRIH
jgi:hypothetical protein